MARTAHFALADSSQGIVAPAAYKSAFSAAISTWEDDEIAIGSAPDITLGADAAVDLDTIELEDHVGQASFIVVVLTDDEWDARLPGATAVLAATTNTGQFVIGSTTTCSQISVIYIHGVEGAGGPPFSDDLPASLGYASSMGTYSEYSLEAVLVHELGHALGSWTHTSGVGTMQAGYPPLVDAGRGVPRVSNDANKVIRSWWPGDSTERVNLTLWPFYPYIVPMGGSNTPTKETWTSDSATTADPDLVWPTGADEVWTNQGDYYYGEYAVGYEDCRPPGPFVATATTGGGAAASVSAEVLIAYTQNPEECPANAWAHDETVAVDTSVATLIYSTPFETSEFYVQPLEPGYYYLCAWIDPNDLIPETKEDDNIIVSDLRYLILDHESTVVDPCIPPA